MRAAGIGGGDIEGMEKEGVNQPFERMLQPRDTVQLYLIFC